MRLPAQPPRRLCRKFGRAGAQAGVGLRPGDTVLVKGSLGSRMAVIVEALKGGGG